MSANLITGNLFSPILASQDSDYQAGVSGDKTLILPVGAKMSLEIEDANTIRANDGVLVTKEGRRVQIDTGAVEEWSIPTGTQGETSYYLIGFHLYTTEESAEICETFIEKVASATDTITENTFKGGATEVYITLGRVTQDGINLESVEGLIDTADSLTDLGAKITQINADLSAIRSHIGMIVQSTTLDTEAKVIAIYGGTAWSKIEGKFLLGQSSSHAVNSTGGAETVTLNEAQMPQHRHSGLLVTGVNCSVGVQGTGGIALKTETFSGSDTINNPYTGATGGSQPHNNMPPFKTVYIWERTA